MRGKPSAEKAMYAVKRAIERGELLPASSYSCSDCGSPAEQYDHRDYAKPLEVEPVCRSCNWYRGSAANNDRRYHNGIEAYGYGFLDGHRKKNEKLHTTKEMKGNPEQTVRDFIDEHWVTWEMDWDLKRGQQEITRGYCKPGYISWTKTFERGLYDWFGIEPL